MNPKTAENYIEFRTSIENKKDPVERSANIFAGELLMPSPILTKICSFRSISPYDLPLSSVFRIPIVRDDFKLTETILNNRTVNILNRKGCFTFKQLLCYSFNSIKRMKCIGEVTRGEIINLAYKYSISHNYISSYIDILLPIEKRTDTSNKSENGSPNINKHSNLKHIKREMLIGALTDFWRNGKYNELSFNLDENYCIQHIIKTTSVLDSNLCLQMLSNIEYVIQIVKCFEQVELSASFKTERECIVKLAYQIPSYIKNKAIYPFVWAYYAKKSRNKCYWLENLNRDIHFHEFVDCITNITDYAHKHLFSEIKKFIEWLSFDIDIISNDIFSILDSNDEHIKKLAYSYNLLYLIWALYDGDEVISKDDVCNIIGSERTDILWYIATKGYFNNSFCMYSNEFDVIFFGINYDYEEIKNIFAELSPVLILTEANSLLDNISVKKNISLKILSIELDKQYIINQSVCYKPNCFPRYLYSYILLNFFKTGYKIDNAQNAETIRLYMKSLFNKQEYISNRSIDAQIMQVGLLCDRGMYIHPLYVSVSNEIIAILKQYILVSKKERISFKELFDDLKLTLSDSQIKNRYMLKSIIDHYQICSYRTDRDYIYKT